jgi:predicted RNase H-like HicB family nuclease
MKHTTQAKTFDLKVEFSREDDERWIADIPALPGVTVFGRTRKQALASAEALALRVIADRLEYGEAIPAARSYLFRGSSTQGGVASINRPSSGSNLSIAHFISHATFR